MIQLLVRALWMLLGWLELIALTLILYPAALLGTPPLGNWYRRLFHHWSRTWVHALGVDLRLHQKNRRPLPPHFVLIANHPSVFEDIGIPALFDVDSLAKIELRDWWVVGRIAAAAGTLFVDRASPESRRGAVEQIVTALREGRNIALYPEGGVQGKRLHDHFRHGAFEASLATGVPIVPVFIHYEAQDDFHWGEQTLPRMIWDLMCSRNNRANYYVYDAFYPEEFPDKEHFNQVVYGRYREWQQKYLD